MMSGRNKAAINTILYLATDQTARAASSESPFHFIPPFWFLIIIIMKLLLSSGCKEF